MNRYLIILITSLSLLFFSFAPREGGTETSNQMDAQTIAFLEELPIESSGQQTSADLLMLFGLLGLGIAAIGLHRTQRKRANNMTKWANKNPIQAQVAIVGVQIPMMVAALYMGYNFNQMGIQFSPFWSYLGPTLIGIGFATTPFLYKKRLIVLPKQLYNQQAKYLMISAATVMSLSSIGAGLETNMPHSPLTQLVRQIDYSIFPAEVEEVKELPIKPGKKQKAKKKKRKKNSRSKINKYRTMAGISCGLAIVIFIFIMIPLLCGSICVTIFGIASLLDGGGILLFIAGLVLTILFTWLSVKLFRNCKGNRSEPSSIIE